MKDEHIFAGQPDPDCLMCKANLPGLACTLHGGNMTASEVRLRNKLSVVGGRWVERGHEPSAAAAAIFQPIIDRKFELMRKMKMLP